jgi:hypothetical protein
MGGGSRFKASPTKKIIKTPSQQIIWVWWYMPLTLARQETQGEESPSEASHRQKA